MDFIYGICIRIVVFSGYLFGISKEEDENNDLNEVDNEIRLSEPEDPYGSETYEERTQSEYKYSYEPMRGSYEMRGNTYEYSDYSDAYEGPNYFDTYDSTYYEYPSAYNWIGSSAGLGVALNKKGHGYQWRNGIIPYIVDTNSYDEIIIDRIRAATKVIETASCLVFTQIYDRRELPKYKDFFLIIANPRKIRNCVHKVMRGVKGQPTLVLGYECMQERDIIHALMHFLGYNDEVTHPHRDSHIRVLWDNIQPKYRNLFAINRKPHLKVGEYDTMSIMHFHDRAYSINGAPTIVPLVPGQLINPSDKLSLLDKMKLRTAFRHECNKRKVANLLQTCKNTVQGPDEHDGLYAMGTSADQELIYADDQALTGNGSEDGIDKNCNAIEGTFISESDKGGSVSEKGKHKQGSSSGSEKDKHKEGSFSGSEKHKYKEGSFSGSEKDKEGSMSGKDIYKESSFSGSDKDKGGSMNVRDVDKEVSFSGSDKGTEGSMSGKDKDKEGSFRGSDKDRGGFLSENDKDKEGSVRWNDNGKLVILSGSESKGKRTLTGSGKASKKKVRGLKEPIKYERKSVLKKRI